MTNVQEAIFQLQDPATLWLRMWNPERWGPTLCSIWVNVTKTGSQKGRRLAGQQGAGVSTWNRWTYQELLPLPRSPCQSSLKCSKVMTFVVPSRHLQKTGECCTQVPPTTAHPDLHSREASSHWNPHQDISVEPSTSLSLLLCLFPYVCRLSSALTAHLAGDTTKTKRQLWRPARSLQSTEVWEERATRFPNWSQRSRREQTRKPPKCKPLENFHKVRLSSFNYHVFFNQICCLWLHVTKTCISFRFKQRHFTRKTRMERSFWHGCTDQERMQKGCATFWNKLAQTAHRYKTGILIRCSCFLLWRFQM